MSTEPTKQIDDGGPAFPQPLAFSPSGAARVASEYFQNVEGMSLRDWLAGQALAGAFSSARNLGQIEPSIRTEIFTQTAKLVYEAADAMLAARKGGAK